GHIASLALFQAIRDHLLSNRHRRPGHNPGIPRRGTVRIVYSLSVHTNPDADELLDTSAHTAQPASEQATTVATTVAAAATLAVVVTAALKK
ncbi:hypothetical protein ACT3SP_18015, partial [Brachybacterium sp. AOP43-C2-M15]|uniref:hypothetical protein n=1 Tax=Brachybacterium sp. AOP43-C2-M15 TaxID=3457661 RepID=UPI00403403AA